MSIPTAANMKFKFPRLCGPIDDATIEFALEEAAVMCAGGEWIDDANETLGITYYAAHLLQVAVMRAQSGTGQVITSERTPDLSVSYAEGGRAADFTLTWYGERFLRLARLNFPAVLTANCAVRM